MEIFRGKELVNVVVENWNCFNFFLNSEGLEFELYIFLFVLAKSVQIQGNKVGPNSDKC